MKFAKLFRQGPPYAGAREKLTAAIGAGKITEETDVPTAMRLVFGPPDHIDFTNNVNTAAILIAIKMRGPEFDFPVHTVRELLWLLERLDREDDRKRKKQIPQ